MKKRFLLIIGLLVLYMTPVFTQASYLDESSDSIPYFTETLNDDQLFVPDTNVLLTDGYMINATETYSYENMTYDDGAYWQGFPYDSDARMYFVIQDAISETVHVSYDAISSGPLGDLLSLYLLDPYSDADILIDSHYQAGASDCVLNEDNVKIENFMQYEFGGNHTFYWKATTGSKVIQADYFRLQCILSNGSYYESFADISDWTYLTGPDTPSTDGDVGIQYVEGDWSSDSIYTNALSLLEGTYYAELRYRRNSSAGACDFRPILYTQDDIGGTQDQDIGTLHPTTTWQTTKTIINIPNIESLLFYTRAGSDTEIQVDYFRISPSNEFGFQHDCSTDAYTNVANGGTLTVSSDHDIITLSGNDANYDEVQFKVDATTTEADLKIEYYPFLEVRWSAPLYQDCQIQVYDENSAGYAYSLTETGGYQITRLNLEAFVTGGDYVSRVDFYDGNDNSQYFSIDYVKLYSIADFDVTQANLEYDDYLYTSGGTLIANIDGTSEYFLLDNDLTLSTNGTIYNNWSIGVESTYPEIQFYNGSWTDWSNGSTMGPSPENTITDLKIRFNATGSIYNVLFIDVHTWHEVETAILIFDLPNWNVIATAIITFWLAIDPFTIGMFFVFLGLLFIPLSSVYLAYSYRSGQLTSDRALIGLLLFIFGWSFILGVVI